MHDYSGMPNVVRKREESTITKNEEEGKSIKATKFNKLILESKSKPRRGNSRKSGLGGFKDKNTYDDLSSDQTESKLKQRRFKSK